MKNIFKLILIVPVFVAALNSCEEDTEYIGGDDNYITNFTLTGDDGITYKGLITEGEVLMQVPEGVSLHGADANVNISSNATIAPDPESIVNWNEEEVFRVTSHSSAKRMYIYKIERADVSALGNVSLTTQAEVDAFAEEGLTVIDGNLIIGKASTADTITNLSALESLKEVTYNIVVNKSYLGKDLAGLGNIEKIGGIKISGLDSLESISMPKLQTVGTNISIENPSLRTVALPELTHVGESFSIKAGGLELVSLGELTSMGESFVFYGATGTRGQGSSISILSLPKLQTVGSNMEIGGWAEVYKIDMPSLSRVSGTLTMSYIDKLEELSLEELAEVGGASFSSLSGLSRISTPKFTTVNGNLEFAGLSAMLSLSANSITNIGGTLTLNLPAATSANFEQLETISGDLKIPSGASYLSVFGFPKLTKVAGRFEVKSKGYMELDGFSALEEIGAELYIYGNAQISSLAGFSALKKVGEYYLYGMAALTELDVRGQEVGKIDALTTTMDGLTIIADDNFNGDLVLNSLQCNSTAPVLQGFKTIKYLQIRNFQYYTDPIVMEGIEEITTLLDMPSLLKTTQISFPDLKKVGKINISYANALQIVDFPALTEMTGYTDGDGEQQGGLSYTISSDLAEFNVPALTTVNGDFYFNSIDNDATITAINIPVVTSISGTLTISGQSNSTFNDVSNFGSLTTVGAVSISRLSALSSFEGLANAVGTLSKNTWSVSGCAYNPTYQSMLDGAYSSVF
ncbi:MAG: hypothetical protein ACK5JS_00050 [Mangrovibacterium sp.]